MIVRFSFAWLSALMVLFVANTAFAEFKPTKTIELIAPADPGGGADVMARFIAGIVEKEKLAPVRLQVVNKPGGSGVTAMNYVAEKKGDAHAVALFSGIWMINSLTLAEAKISVKDMTPLLRMVLEPAVIAVKSDAPFKSMQEFIDSAKRNPGQLKQSGGSITSRDNIVRQLLMKSTGSNWVFISFPGGAERIAALLGGHVNMMVIEPQEIGEQVRAGNMRVLAQISEKRLPNFPNAPTLKEAGFDIPNVPQVRGIIAPPDIPADVAAYYEDLFTKVAQTAAWKKYLQDNQLEDGFQKGPELNKFINEFTNRMRDILKEAGAKIVR